MGDIYRLPAYFLPVTGEIRPGQMPTRPDPPSLESVSKRPGHRNCPLVPVQGFYILGLQGVGRCPSESMAGATRAPWKQPEAGSACENSALSKPWVPVDPPGRSRPWLPRPAAPAGWRRRQLLSSRKARHHPAAHLWPRPDPAPTFRPGGCRLPPLPRKPGRPRPGAPGRTGSPAARAGSR